MLVNLVRRLDGERDSYLAWARANDDDAYREAEARRRAAGLDKPKKRKPSIELYEYTPVVELLAQISALLQQNVHASYTHGSKAAKKRPKITHFPTPSTSAKRLKKADEREALAKVESLVVFTDEPYAGRPDLVTERSQPAGDRGVPGRMRPPDRARAHPEPPAAADFPPWAD